jgi:hypothetical protein
LELQLRFGPRWPEGSRELKNRGPSDVFGAVAAKPLTLEARRRGH